jgi:hypothetical protein
MMHISWARDLDPKGLNSQIKEALDKNELTDDEAGNGAIVMDE